MMASWEPDRLLFGRPGQGTAVGAPTVGGPSSEGSGTLADSEARFRTVVEILSEGLIISDLGGNLLHWNVAAL
ncbi:MAG: hypothetical protein EHM13_08610, partial [Acidobacteria bacterium]